MLPVTLANQDHLYRHGKAVIARFAGRRRVVSTAPHQGGSREDLTGVFNYTCTEDGQEQIILKAPTYAAHMALVAAELGLDPDRTAGLSTAASMDNLSIETRCYGTLIVTVAVTAGIDINGSRVGEYARWHESEGLFFPTPGTINMIVFINANLSDGALVRTIITATEAKTAALQELMAPSCYSSGLATGSGTDGMIVVSDAESDIRLTEAGTHCKLGELIGQAVIAACKSALRFQTGLDTERQFSVLSRLGRFGITADSLWKLAKQDGQYAGCCNWDSLNWHRQSSRYEIENQQNMAGLHTVGENFHNRDESNAHAKMQFIKRLELIDRDPDLVMAVSLYAHTLDQMIWHLVEPEVALRTAQMLLWQIQAGEPVLPDQVNDLEQMLKTMLTGIGYGLLRRLGP